MPFSWVEIDHPVFELGAGDDHRHRNYRDSTCAKVSGASKQSCVVGFKKSDPDGVAYVGFYWEAPDGKKAVLQALGLGPDTPTDDRGDLSAEDADRRPPNKPDPSETT